MSKKSRNITINILVEGQTEKNYFTGFKKELDNKFTFKITNMKSGNYSSFVRSFKGTDQIVFIITDLDRAISDNNELNKLYKLIDELYKQNKLNNIFLSYKNFETFLAFNFYPFENNLKNRLCLKDSKDIKNKENIYESIVSHNGCFDNCNKHFTQQDLFYSKIDNTKGIIIKENLYKKHSSLINFKKVCEYISKNRK